MSTPRTNPYIGPRTFMKEERRLFFGRDREARDLQSLVVSHRLVLFYAQSGAGKSSIINTRLIPHLEEERGFEVFPVGRVSGDLAPEGVDSNVYTYNLMRKLIQHEADANVLAGLSLSQFLANLNSDEKGYFYDSQLSQNKPEDYLQWRHALIIDQFEELFSTHPEAWKKREDFFCQLADAMKDDPYLWVILVMREDYIASLDPYAHLLPDGLKVRYYMQRLGREAALKAIKNPVAELRPYAPNVAEKLVDDLCSIKVQNPDGSQGTQPGQYVEPVQLQVVCYSLWENLEDGTEITEEDLRKVGDVDKALGTYYAGRVKSVAANEKLRVTESAIRRWFETSLITEGGIRNMVLQEPSKKSGGLLDDAVIQALQSDLVRAEKRSGATWYELTHDRLVEPILADNRAWFEKNASVLQRQAKLWNDQARNINLLLRDQALVDAMEWAKKHDDELRKHERDFLKASEEWQEQLEKRREIDRMKLEQAEQEARAANRMRRLTRLAFSLLGLALIAVAVAVWGVVSANKTAQDLLDTQAQVEAEAARANELKNAALARELASQATENLDKQLDLAILLGLEAYNQNAITPNAQIIPQVEGILFDSIQRTLRMRGYLATSEEPTRQFEYSPDGKHIALLKDEGIVLWNLGQSMSSEVIPETEFVDQYFFTPDGSNLVYLDHGGVTFWDVQNSRKMNDTPINGHWGAVEQVVFDSEGANIVTAGENGNLTVWDADSRSAIFTPLDVRAYAISPDRQKFAILDRDGNITIYGMNDVLAQGSPISADPHTTTSLAFNQAGDRLAVGSSSGEIAVWAVGLNQNAGETNNCDVGDAAIDKLIFSSGDNPGDMFLTFTTTTEIGVCNLATGELSGENILITGPVITSSDGQLFAIVDPDSAQIFLYDTTDREGTPRSPVPGTYAVFSPDGTRLAVFSESDSSLRLVDVATGDSTGEPFPEELDGLIHMVFSRDGSSLAVASENGTVQVRRVSDWRLEYQNTLTGRQMSAMTFSLDGKTLLIGSKDSSLILWEMESNSIRTKETGYEGKITSIALSPDGSYVYTSANDGLVLIDARSTDEVGGVFPGGDLIFSKDNDLLAIVDRSTKTGICSLWALPSGRRIKGGIQCNSIEFSPTGDRMASTQEIGEISSEITVWDTSDARALGSPVPGTILSFTADGRRALIHDAALGTITLLDAENGNPVGEPIQAETAFLSASGNVAAMIDSSGNLIIVDTITAEVTGSRPGHTFLGFSPNGKVLVAQDYSTGSVVFFDVTSMEPIGDPVAGITTTSLSPDGRRIAISTYSGTGVWDTATGKRIDNFSTAEAVWAFHFSPEGDYAITSDYYNNYTTLWDIDTGEKTRLGESLTFQGFSPDGNFVLLYSGPESAYILWDMAARRDVGGGLRGHAGNFNGGWLNEFGNLHVTFENNMLYYESQSTVVGDLSGQFGQHLFMLSPDEETYAALNPLDGSVSVWNVQSPPSIPGTEIGQLEEPLYNAILSPDGGSLAVSTQEGMKLLDAQTASEIGAFPQAHIRLPVQTLLSPNGKFMAVLYTDDGNSLSVWNLEENKQVISALEESFHSFSPDGSRLVTYPVYQTFTLWDTATGRKIGKPFTGESLQFSRDGKYLVSYSYYGGTITIIDAASGAQFGEQFSGSLMGMGPGEHSIIISDATSVKLVDISADMDVLSSIPNDGQSYFYLSPNGRYLAGISFGPPVLWDVEAHKQIGQINDFSGEFRGFSPQGELIYFYSYDEAGYVLFETAYPNKRITEDPIRADYLIFSPDDELFIPFSYYASSDSLITPYRSSTGEKLAQGIRGSFQGFVQNGDLIATLRDQKTLYLWSTEDSGEPPQTIEYSGTFQGSGFNEGGSTLTLFGSGGVTIKQLADPDRPAQYIWETTGLVQSMEFSPDGKILATIGSDGLILWNVESRTPMGETIAPENSYIAGVSFSPDGSRLVYMDGLGNAFEIDLTSKNEIKDPKRLPVPNNICTISFDAESHLLVVKQTLDRLLIENMDNDQMTQLEEGSCANPMAFSQDGKSFTYSVGSRIFVFRPDHEQGTPFARPTEIIGDQSYYSGLNFVLDGSLLAVNGTDGRMQFWDVESRSLVFAPQERAQLTSIYDGVALFYIPGEKRLVSLDFKPASLLTAFEAWKTELCTKAGRNFTVSESQQYFPDAEYRRTCEQWPAGE